MGLAVSTLHDRSSLFPPSQIWQGEIHVNPNERENSMFSKRDVETRTQRDEI